jgi:hypothetical protein
MNSITGIPTLENYYSNNLFNPIIIIVLVSIIIFYLILFGSLGGSSFSFFSSSSSSSSSSSLDNNLFNSNNSDKSASGSVKVLSIILISIFIVLVLINGFNYFLNINIVTSIKDFFSKTPEINILADGDFLSKKNGSTSGNNGSISGNNIVPEIKYIKQVYHIPNNNYTYDDANAICKAYGNRLANYKEIDSAYDDGADWCSYGWSEDQMALYPTQYKKWSDLQKIKGHEHDCGRPGINGGYIANPNVKFGVNCYGYKPKINQLESDLMKNTPLYPLTQKDIDFQNKVKYWKNKINNILIAPFNSSKWSRL